MEWKMKKRLGIFVVYDKEGILDRYIFYLLDNMMKYLDTLIIVCNGSVKKEYIDKLYKYTKRIYFRKNAGYDFGAYKEILFDQLNSTDLEQFNELILFNDTFFGPLYSLDSVFDKMEGSGYDFWGITKHPRYKRINGEIIPEHIQSYFLVIGKSMLLSRDFTDFFETAKEPLSMEETIRRFEVLFTDYFSRKGYKWGVYTDMSEYESDEYENNINFYMHMNYQLISELKCPIMKKKSFLSLEYNNSSMIDVKKSLEYIEEHTDYDVDMIWENLLRNYNIADIQNILHLRYCISGSALERYANHNLLRQSTIIVYTKDCNRLFVKQFAKYLNRLSETMKVQIVIHSRSEEALWKQEGNIHDMSFVYTSTQSSMEFVYQEAYPCFESYKYVCYLNTGIAREIKGVISLQMDCISRVCDNLVLNEVFVSNVLGCFENNLRMGFLSPMQTIAGDYQVGVYGKWYSNLESIKRIAFKMGININKYIDHKKCSYVEPSCFWARTEALRCLNKLDKKGIDAAKNNDYVLEKILIYLCQDNGFFSGILENSFWASAEINSLIRLLRKRELKWNEKFAEKNN